MPVTLRGSRVKKPESICSLHNGGKKSARLDSITCSCTKFMLRFSCLTSVDYLCCGRIT